MDIRETFSKEINRFVFQQSNWAIDKIETWCQTTFYNERQHEIWWTKSKKKIREGLVEADLDTPVCSDWAATNISDFEKSCKYDYSELNKQSKKHIGLTREILLW